jgi:hypothetical protein
MIHSDLLRQNLTNEGDLWCVEGWPPCGFKTRNYIFC